MYKILIGLFLSVLCLQAKCQIQFDEGSFTEVLTKAKQEKKMVFMDCYTSWCGPCKMMVQDVFSREDVGQFMNTHFVKIPLLSFLPPFYESPLHLHSRSKKSGKPSLDTS